GAIAHLSALLTDQGLTAGNATLCSSILGGSSLLGRILGGWLLDRFFGPHVAFGRNLITALGIFLLAHAYSFPSGCLAAALIGIGADGDSATTPYPAGALFWSVRIFLPSMASVGLSTPLQELSDLSFWGRRSM